MRISLKLTLTDNEYLNGKTQYGLSQSCTLSGNENLNVRGKVYRWIKIGYETEITVLKWELIELCEANNRVETGISISILKRHLIYLECAKY